uniref:ATP synthase F0 subunit 8 n=1 Tax=Oedipoda caerulescens TaxID=58615 RepID=UPI002551EFAB|nr:ATP synthase F0 subunit 8 [Oedipoda caerulescens]WGC89948.1 ATP synthase F0 subunit 8 [Oedipoda caerulescens]WIW75298.1 ATP synthase F0 subunit 8 [Oedipoda caerulescens]
MPQMSPMMWFSLFILFSIMMIIFNQMNFFLYKPSKIKIHKKMTKKNMNWKW